MPGGSRPILRDGCKKPERGYRAALSISRQAGTHDWTIPKVNLGLVLLLQNKFDDALQILTEAHDVLVKNHRLDIQGGVELALAVCFMANGEHSQSVHYFDLAASKIEDTGILDPTSWASTELLADQAVIQRKHELADRAMALAETHWSRLGDENPLGCCSRETRSRRALDTEVVAPQAGHQGVGGVPLVSH